MNTRFCRYCQQEKPLEQFIKWRGRCESCRKEERKLSYVRMRETKPEIWERHVERENLRYAKNKEKIRAKRRLATYGISQEEFEQMLLKQNGVCFICKNKETKPSNAGGNKNLSVDHCHKTGRVRSLLCQRCNTVVGLLEESADLCQETMRYIKEQNEITEQKKRGQDSPIPPPPVQLLTP